MVIRHSRLPMIGCTAPPLAAHYECTLAAHYECTMEYREIKNAQREEREGEETEEEPTNAATNKAERM